MAITPGKGSVFMRFPLMVHMRFGVSEGGIRESIKGVCRNLIKSMPRRMEVMIQAKLHASKKTDSLNLLGCKIYIR